MNLNTPPDAGDSPTLRACNGIADMASNVGTGLLFAIVAISCANVFGRYVLGAPIGWADEAVIFLMIWAVFLGAAAVAWTDQHIKVEVLVELTPPRVRLAVRAAVDLVTAGVVFLMAWSGSMVVWKLMRFDQRSDALEVPLFIPQGALPVGMSIIGLFVLIRLCLRLRASRPRNETEGAR
jgi:TRAP-type C4-dicarboxylate transport system permease small subunit